jgi:hypothetical protein
VNPDRGDRTRKGTIGAFGPALPFMVKSMKGERSFVRKQSHGR